MIRRSDNAAATAVLGRVGTGRLSALARRAGMRRFRPVAGIWGNSRIDAEDQARFFYRIDKQTIEIVRVIHGARNYETILFRAD